MKLQRLLGARKLLLTEIRPEAELAAAEALLILAGVFGGGDELPIQCASAVVTSKPKQRGKTGIITSTPTQPRYNADYAPFETNQTRQSVILSVNCSGQVENCGNLQTEEKFTPVKSGNDKSASGNSLPSKSKSGRVVKRTKRFISQSDEENTPPSNGKKISGKRSKPTDDKNSSKIISDDEFQPAKKIKTEPTQITKNNSRFKPLKLEIFSKNGTIQQETVRHSRLSEAAYEIEHCTKSNANVDFQARAAEHLAAYKIEIDAKRNQIFASKMTELMQKFRGIKNRQQVCDEFTAKFKPTTGTQWKPFVEDLTRASYNVDYKLQQIANKPMIKILVDEFVRQNHTKERAHSMLIEVFKLLPNRPEVRHEFINTHLPKVIAKHKQSSRKSKSQTIKKELIEINPAFQYYF